MRHRCGSRMSRGMPRHPKQLTSIRNCSSSQLLPAWYGLFCLKKKNVRTKDCDGGPELRGVCSSYLSFTIGHLLNEGENYEARSKIGWRAGQDHELWPTIEPRNSWQPYRVDPRTKTGIEKIGFCVDWIGRIVTNHQIVSINVPFYILTSHNLEKAQSHNICNNES